MRMSKNEYFLRMADLSAKRSTCIRRSVGCVLVNIRGHVVGTGYNGVAAGDPHCNESDIFEPVGYPNACSGAFAKSGEKLDECDAIHAEQNALLQCRNVYEIDTCYCTTAPCITCVKLLKGTSCREIIFLDDYPHAELSQQRWLSSINKFTGEPRVWTRADESLVKLIRGTT